MGIAWYFMSNWIENFEYQISLGWWFYVLPVIMIAVIAIVTVSSQVTKTASVNPAESLRYE